MPTASQMSAGGGAIWLRMRTLDSSNTKTIEYIIFRIFRENTFYSKCVANWCCKLQLAITSKVLFLACCSLTCVFVFVKCEYSKNFVSFFPRLFVRLDTCLSFMHTKWAFGFHVGCKNGVGVLKYENHEMLSNFKFYILFTYSIATEKRGFFVVLIEFFVKLGQSTLIKGWTCQKVIK